MTFDQAELVGALAIAGATALSTVYLILRIRESTTEKPDPKTTYATIKALDQVRSNIDTLQRDNRQEINHLRAEHKSDLKAMERSHLRDVGHIHNLIHRNAEHIAELIARLQMLTQRLAELTVKTDRLTERRHTCARSNSLN